MSSPTQIAFVGFNVLKIIFDRKDLIAETKVEISVQNKIEADPGNKNNFSIIFLVTIGSVEAPIVFQIQAKGDFKIEGEINDKVYENYTKISAPSMTFPYLRAFIHNLFLQAGMTPIILPAINFVPQKQPPPG